MRLGNMASEPMGPDDPFKNSVLEDDFWKAILFKRVQPVCSKLLKRGGKVAGVKKNYLHLFYDWSSVTIGQPQPLQSSDNIEESAFS